MAAVAKVVTTPGHMQNSSSAGEYALISGTNDSTTTAIKNGISSSTSKHHSTEKHSELNERRYDLNSFAPVKLNPEPSDGEDDLPLSVRKQQKTPVENNVHKENHRVSLPSTSSTPNNNNNVKIKIKKEEIKNEVLSPVKEKHSTTVHPEKVKHEISSPEPTFNSHKSPPSADRSAKKRLAIVESDDEDEMSLSERAKKVKQTKPGSSEKKVAKKRPKDESEEEYEEENEEEEDDDYRPSTKKSKHDHKSKYKENGVKKHVSSTPTEKSKSTKKLDATLTPTTSPKKRGGKKKEEEQQEVWRWWEEEKHESGVKWKFLEHKGPMFASAYECLPESVKFYYGGKPMKLSEDTEEVATFYAKMLDHDYTAQEQFNKNFFKDWRKVMTSKEREKITDLKLCDFKEIGEYFKKISEERRNRSKEEKLKEKEEKDKIQKEFGIATIDGHKEKIGNFRIEPPGLFRGRGTHPKMGMLKKRILPEDVIINCSKDSKAPQAPHGHKWKEVRHDNTVTWLASWSENIMGNIKYVMLNPASKIKGEKDWQKYETARKLKTKVSKIRTNYREDWKSKEMKNRQRAVALYFIDKLALRAGNEKEEGETADTVGCCSLRCEHIKLHEVLDGEHVVEFDFLGKDSIRYYNKVSVEKRVFKNLKLFMENKQPGDDVFDRLNTMILNKHLTSLMEGLTAKVFRTYNASFTLQQQLDLLTKKDMTVAEKLLAYNRANRQVAILCNHQRSVPKAHSKQMETLQEKIKEKAGQVKQAKKEAKEAKRKYKESKSDNSKKAYEQKKKQAERLDDQLQKLELRATDKEENKEISLGTSKLNYLDPRISVAWCKKWEIPIEKIYNKTQREKFRWAIDMATATFVW